MNRVLLAAAVTVLPLAAVAQDNAARALAAPCAICHGTEGRAVTKDVVPLAGLSREHIASQMKAFRDGKRPATVMHQVAKGYTDAEIERLGAYFAGQRR
jgi:cytochrome subunit of sulfide dehydrogenase